MRKIVFALMAMSLMTVNFVNAQDNETKEESKSNEFKRWQVRLRAVGVAPEESAKIGIIGGDVAISNALIPELDFTYFFTAQYHFYTSDQKVFKPYIGAGVNYTLFYNVKSGDVAGVEYDNALGYAAQVGFDLMLDDTFFINFDAKRLFLSTDVTVDASNLAPGLSIPAEVDINPWLIGVGVGMKF